jgi:PAS domain S-box-containing protein
MRFLILYLIIISNVYSLESKNILILNSYHKGFEISDTIIKNIEKKLFNNKNINIDILYMNSKQIHSRNYIKKLSELYSLQLKDKHYDLVITIDSFAYKFAIKNYSKLFTTEKILFTGVEQFSKELAKIYGLENKIFGIIQKLQIKDNINLILQTMPNVKKLYIINDRSSNGNDSSPFILSAISKIKSQLNVEYLRDDSLDEFIAYFKEHRKNEAILFVRYSNDANNNYYKTNEVLEAINSFNLPVFVTDNLFIKKGVLGGKLVSIEKLGIQTANKALNILNEKKLKSNIHINNEFKFIFDYNVLQKYDIKLSKKFNEYQLVNAPISFFNKHRKLINSVFLLSPILVLIIAYLIFLLYSKYLTQKELKKRMDFDKVLLNSINSPIFWKDSNGAILDANHNFCELIGIDYKNLHNHKLENFRKKNIYIDNILSILQKHNQNRLKNSQFIFNNSKMQKKVYHIQTTSYVDSNSKENACVTIFTDITKEKELENDRLKHTQYMIQQSKLAEIGEIFSSIAHQWKSPLVAITALAQDLFYSFDTKEKEEDSYHINNIMLQVQYMTNTINEFQEFIIPSRKKTLFNIHDTIKSLLNIVQHTIKYNYIEVDIKISPNTNLEIFGYENELMQAILNIINNSKDALVNNDIKNKRISIIIKGYSDYISIDFIDNAGGIPYKMQKKIFLQYFSTKDTGSGIGLYMSKLLIEDKMNGKISYKKIDDGSSFRIKFKQNKDIISFE